MKPKLSKLLLCASLLTACSQAAEYQLEELATELKRPWGLAFIDAGQIVITEKAGSAQLFDLASGQRRPLSGLPKDIYSRGQGGLMDVKYHPNGWLYFTYNKASDEGRGRTTLARAKLEGSALTQWQDLLVSDSVSVTGRHYGSRIAFGPDGHLYFGVGDRGVRAPAQDNSNHIGTVLRVDLEGKALADNPFYGQANIKPEIYSYGHRNPQGLAFDGDGQLWEIEHGPRGGDEINKIVAGANYGWPRASYGREYSEDKPVGEASQIEGMLDAAVVYIPSIAPSSLMIYSGAAFPQWQGQFFAGALAMTHLNRLGFDAQGKLQEQERMLADKGLRIRHVAEGPEGYIYLLTDAGRLLRLKPAP